MDYKNSGAKTNGTKPEKGANTESTKMLLVFFAGLVIGAIATPLALGIPLWPESAMLEKDTTLKVGVAEVGDRGIVVLDQIAGDRVSLEKIVTKEFNWVVVHEEVDSILGNALGAQRFESGTYTDGYVKLLRNTEPGRIYHVVLYSDNGDKEFNLAVDRPVYDSQNQMIQDTFTTLIIDKKPL